MKKKRILLVFLNLLFIFIFNINDVFAIDFPSGFPSDAKISHNGAKHYYYIKEGLFSVHAPTKTVSYNVEIGDSKTKSYEVYRNGSLYYQYTYDIDDYDHGKHNLYDISDLPSGVYRIITYHYDGSVRNDILIDLTGKPPSDVPPITEDDHELSNALKLIRSEIINGNNSNSKKIDRLISELSDLKNTFDTNLNKVLEKMNTSNDYLSQIRDNTKNISDNLNTSKQPSKNQAPDYSKELENNRPNQNEDSFIDNNTYFSEGSHKQVNDLMPDPNQEPKQWEGVQKPVEQIKDSELIKDSEKNRDQELISDQEFLKDNELTQDQFENSEIYEKSDELIRDEFIKDNELSIDEFTADSELKQDQFVSDKELIKDVMRSDDELTKDEFDQTENYDNTNYFQQSEIYESDSENYNLRWKSINGEFQ